MSDNKQQPPKEGFTVYINVYDILALKVNNYLACGGLGIFHTGVEVNG